jgi:hypothetical protein
VARTGGRWTSKGAMMDIRIVDGHIKTTPAMIEYVTSHVAAEIGNFADSFTSVDVHIRDEIVIYGLSYFVMHNTQKAYLSKAKYFLNN